MNKSSLALLLLAQLLFAMLPSLTKISLAEMHPLFLVASRSVAAAFCFWIFCKFAKIEIALKIGMKNHISLAGLGALGVTLNQGTLFFALQRTTSSAAVLLSPNIALMGLLFAVVLKRDTFTLWKLLNLLFGFAGVYLFLFGEIGKSFDAGNSLGNAMCFASTTMYALYLCLSSNFTNKFGALVFSFWVFLYASFINLVFVIAWIQFNPRIDLVPNFSALSAPAIWAYAIVLLGCTVFTYGVNAFLLKTVSSAVLSGFVCLQVSLGLFFSRVLVGEIQGPREIFSLLLVTFGILFLVWENKIRKKTVF